MTEKFTLTVAFSVNQGAQVGLKCISFNTLAEAKAWLQDQYSRGLSLVNATVVSSKNVVVKLRGVDPSGQIVWSDS